MDKTFHLMAGLPRSGSTILTAILNQHPDLYVSPQTDLLQMLYTLHKDIPTYESFNAELRSAGYENVLKKLPYTFYEDINKSVIIDKNRGWGTPYNFDNLSKFMNSDVKVILTLRPILEVLASFIRKANKNPNNYIDSAMANTDFFPSYYRNIQDARCDYLMRPNGDIDKSLLSIFNLIKNHKDKVKVVWYSDLISNPDTTLDSIIKFLNLSKFQFNLNSIKETDKHNDINAFGIKDLHTIKSTLSTSKRDPSKVLSDYIINKYKNTLDFLVD